MAPIHFYLGLLLYKAQRFSIYSLYSWQLLADKHISHCTCNAGAYQHRRHHWTFTRSAWSNYLYLPLWSIARSTPVTSTWHSLYSLSFHHSRAYCNSGIQPKCAAQTERHWSSWL